MSRKKTLIISAAILIGGVVLTALIFMTEPTAQRSGAVKQSAMLVEVTYPERGTFRPSIRAMGTVEPAQEIVLSSRVGGEVVARSRSFTPGGYVERGEVLLRLDPADYENVLAQQRSTLQQARAEMEIEMGRQNVARQDYDLIADTLSETNRALVLREPQLETARARVQSAEAEVRQAELDLRRTVIRAPFDAHVIGREVDIGSQVDPGNMLGQLVGLEQYWVSATVPLARLRWLPERGEAGTSVQIRDRTAWDPGQYRSGEIYNVVGTLEDRTRMARVLISVPDPHALGQENPNLPRLMIGSYVEAQIPAQELSDVVRLDRDYLREDDAVWVMRDSTLAIMQPEILFRDPEYAYIREGLSETDPVVTTNLATVTEGARLRLDEPNASPDTAAADQPE